MSAGESTFSGVQLRPRRAPLPRLQFRGRSYEATTGSMDDVWDVIFDAYPAAYDGDYEAKRVLELVNARRLVVVHRFESGRAVEFLYSPDLLKRAIPELLAEDA